jgi:hypothetical protein
MKAAGGDAKLGKMRADQFTDDRQGELFSAR